MECLFGSPGDYSFLRIFGCACWHNLRPYNQHKLQFRSKQCAFLGYSNLHKGYKCRDISTGRVYISWDVVFDETVFPFSALHSNAGTRLRAEINLLPPTLQPLHLHMHEGHDLQEPSGANPTNAAIAESFIQDSGDTAGSGDDSAAFSGSGTPFDDDLADSPGGQSSAPDSFVQSTSGFPPSAPSATAPGTTHLPPTLGPSTSGSTWSLSPSL
jgi:hypothetical protein